MAKKSITLKDVLNFIDTLPYNQFRGVVQHYSEVNKADFNKEMNAMITLNFQQRLEALGVNKTCPICNSSHIVKNGKRSNGTFEYKCKDCNKKFTLFTNTVIEKSRWHWDLWVKVLEMTINNYSLDAMIEVLEKDYCCKGINKKTVWLWRLKLIHALASVKMPILTGVIQVDKTFVRESQNGSRTLINYLDKEEVRKARYGYSPSKYGVMGSEFATITTAIDNRGYCVCKVSSLGKLTKEIFTDLFDSHFDNPAYICSDANPIYKDYCNLLNIVHYERPSNYYKIIEKNGYEQPDYNNPATVKTTEENNKKILEALYKADMIDKITNRGNIPFKEFTALKNEYSLSLARVNELHSDIKHFIYGNMKNVSTKYLQNYIGFSHI